MKHARSLNLAVGSVLMAGTCLSFAGIFGCTDSIPARGETGTSAGKTLPTVEEPTLSHTQLAEQFALPEPTPSNPVVASMKFHPEGAVPGSKVELLVYVRIARVHYVHARNEAKSHFSPLEVSVDLPEELQAEGAWRFPHPDSKVGDERIYRNSLLLRLPVKVASQLPESQLKVSGKLSFQVCTDELCWPSQSVDVSAPFIIQPSGGSP